MKFYYKRFGPDIFRPVIPVEIKALDKHLKYEALIDSGADECIFDAQLAEILGIDVQKGAKRMVGGITGKEQPYYSHQITISIGGWEYETKAGFMPHMPGFGYGVLGQRGFFENFTVKFNYSKLEIELNPKVKN